MNTTVEYIDTSTIKVDAATTFNVEKSHRDQFTFENKSPTDRKQRVTLSNNVLLATLPNSDGNDQMFLVGTGMSVMRDPMFTTESHGTRANRLASNLKNRAKAVNYVVCSSLHYLYDGNLTQRTVRGDDLPICPNATFVIHEDEWAAAFSHDPYFQTRYRGVREELRKIERNGADIILVNDDEFEIAPGVRMVKTGGVTPANSTIIIQLGSESVAVSPLVMPTRYHIAPEVQFAFSMNQRDLYARKLALLDMLNFERTSLFMPMDPNIPTMYIDKDRYNRYHAVPSTIFQRQLF